MKWFARATLALVMLMPVMSLRDREETGEHWRDRSSGRNALDLRGDPPPPPVHPRDDRRVSQYCDASETADEGACTWIREEAQCNERAPLCQWHVKEETGESLMAVNSDPKDDGRVSYYCAALVPDGSCNWIKDKDECNERKGICIWKTYP